MSQFTTIRPGTNLAQHARELVRVHDAVMSGSRSRVRPRPVVERSWRRVLCTGMDPSRPDDHDPLSMDEVLRRRAASRLALVIDDLLGVVSSVAEASRFLMVVTDAQGVVLWRAGAAAVRCQADALGFTEGAEWTEQRAGTNAIGTALAEASPLQLFSAEHFKHDQHPWYCVAAPIHDAITADLLGIVDVSGPALTFHPAIGALVHTAVRLGELRLRGHHEARLERLRRSAEPVLAGITGPVLVVDDDGWVAHHAGVAVRDRIAVPRAEAALAVPGLGICLPERLAEGWLVRPAAGPRAIRAVVDVTTAATLEVRSADDIWRTALSHRHAEILRLIHAAGPAGMSAAALSLALYGDAEHTVTVRAEISRMRRQIGALVDTRPYRLADGVQMTVLA